SSASAIDPAPRKAMVCSDNMMKNSFNFRNHFIFTVAMASAAATVSRSAWPSRGLFAHLAIAEDDILRRRQRRQPERAACVQLLRADPELRAEAEFEPVGEARGSVVVYGRRIDLLQEAAGIVAVFSDDALGMLRAEPVDMAKRLVQPVDDAHVQNKIVIFR